MVRLGLLCVCCALIAADHAAAETADEQPASSETETADTVIPYVDPQTFGPLSYRELLEAALPDPEPADQGAPDITPASPRRQPADWSGEASLSANAKTGNTESADFGAALKFKRETTRWSSAGAIVYDYGESAGDETKNRLFTDYQLDFIFNDRAFVFGRGNYKLDEFDGYEYRANLGGGLGYDLVDRDNADWSLQVGPAAQIDAAEAIVDEDADTVITPASTDTDLAIALGSRISGSVNDKVQLGNNTDITWEEDTTIYFNSASLTAQLLPSLATRFSVDITHDTDPIADKEMTDTTTRASIIYSFGS